MAEVQVCALWVEGAGAADVDVGLVERLQQTHEVGALRLSVRKHTGREKKGRSQREDLKSETESYLQTFAGQAAVLHVLSFCGPVNLITWKEHFKSQSVKPSRLENQLNPLAVNLLDGDLETWRPGHKAKR